MKNGHGGKESDVKSISMPSVGSLSVVERVGEVWIRELPRQQLRDERGVDGVLVGECRDGGDQVVQMAGFFLPLLPPSSRLAPLLSSSVPQLLPPFSYLEPPLFPSAFGHPIPSKSP